MTLSLSRTLAAAGLVVAIGTSASAQSFDIAWQMQPYCNRVALRLTPTPAGFTLDGTDDQCGAVDQGSVVGVASPNGGGNYTLNFSIVTAPSGKPVHVSAVVSPATGSGTWNDSVGNSGSFVIGGATPALPARPLPASGLPASIITTTEIAAGAVGAADINTAEVQARVTGTCSAGQAVTGVNANGTVTCAATGSNVQFHVQGHATQSIPSSAMTTVTGWSNVLYNDGGGTYSAGVYTVPVTGLYSVTATPFWNGGFAAGQLGLDITRNNARIGVTWGNADINAVTAILPTVTTVAKFNAGDTIRIRVFQDSGAARPLSLTGSDSNFMVTLIR